MMAWATLLAGGGEGGELDHRRELATCRNGRRFGLGLIRLHCSEFSGQA
jgi:hypothetical protein